ncbi:MAG TPA: hypothetical protein VKZ60_14685 [Chloroflexota bacterium]|jgi:hypothetical protein|nr:hypothetical protein [Chloroflexota bacterium]
MRVARWIGFVGALALLGTVATPVAWAADYHWHHHHPHGHGVVVVPQPVPVAPAVVAPAPAVVAVPVPVTAVPVPVQNVIVPALQQVLPPGALQQAPLQLYPLGANQYALIHPLLFCGADTAGTCQQLAQQLAQVAPGFGTAVLNGPNGYGVYVTYQG